jgi:flagellar hook-basal body complex protein FliE
MKIIDPQMLLQGPENLAKTAPAPSSSPEPGVFRRLLEEVNGRQQQADLAIRQSLTGDKDLHEVMLALEQASLGLKLLVQMRNKMLQAYEELSRMPL